MTYTSFNPNSESVLDRRMVDALDEAVERMLKVLLKWGEDSRGPSNSWTLGIAEVVEVLVRCREALTTPASSRFDYGEDSPNESWRFRGDEALSLTTPSEQKGLTFYAPVQVAYDRGWQDAMSQENPPEKPPSEQKEET